MINGCYGGRVKEAGGQKLGGNFSLLSRHEAIKA